MAALVGMVSSRLADALVRPMMQYRSAMSIFVSIAAYCDPVLPFTLRRAVEQATHPEALHLVVVNQRPAGSPPLDESGLAPSRLTVLDIDATQARGPCWARALAMTLYEGEDWFFQIDSHMDFDPGWDTRLIHAAHGIARHQRRCVISSYPNAFEFEGGHPVSRAVTGKVLAHVLKPGCRFAEDHPVLSFEAHPVEIDAALRGYHLGAGCLFAPGAFVQQFPYDPYLYFHGEEQALAARLYTHGWDIFHIPALPVYHLYRAVGADASARPLHWDAAHDQVRKNRWWALEARSRARLQALVTRSQDLGVYGLGSERTMAQYAAFCGIDYELRTIAPRAFHGPWGNAQRPPAPNNNLAATRPPAAPEPPSSPLTEPATANPEAPPQ
jgi:hypothetical protein